MQTVNVTIETLSKLLLTAGHSPDMVEDSSPRSLESESNDMLRSVGLAVRVGGRDTTDQNLLDEITQALI